MSESTGVLLLILVGLNSNLVRLMKSTVSEPGLSLKYQLSTIPNTHRGIKWKDFSGVTLVKP